MGLLDHITTGKTKLSNILFMLIPEKNAQPGYFHPAGHQVCLGRWDTGPSLSWMSLLLWFSLI